MVSFLGNNKHNGQTSPTESRELFNMELPLSSPFHERRDSQTSQSSVESETDQQLQQQTIQAMEMDMDLRFVRRGAACGEELLRHHPCPPIHVQQRQLQHGAERALQQQAAEGLQAGLQGKAPVAREVVVRAYPINEL